MTSNVGYEEVEEEGWFGSNRLDTFTSSFANKLRETIPTPSSVKQTLDGIAVAIHRSASTLANEFSEMEKEAREQSEREKVDEFLRQYRREREQKSLQDFVECCKIAFSKLPWEVWRDVSTEEGECFDTYNPTGTVRRGEFVEDAVLKEKILILSQNENTFTEPFLDNGALVMDEDKQYGCDLDYDAQYCYYEKKEKQTEQMFLEKHAGSIRRLLEIDENLLKAHSSLSGRVVKESIFWRNYFYNCERVRVQKCTDVKSASQKQNLVGESFGNRSPSVEVTSTPKASSNDDDSTSKTDEISTRLTSPTSSSLMGSSTGHEESFASSLDSNIYEQDAVLVDGTEVPSVKLMPHTLSSGSLVLIGADANELQDLASDVPM